MGQDELVADRPQVFSLKKVLGLLECEVIAGSERIDGIEISSCFASDLMSDVLAYAAPGTLLITELTTVQAIHTADVADLAAIIFVGKKEPRKAVLDLARRKGIPVLRTEQTMFEVCGILAKLGLRAASKQ
jgi:predicted transcriptional regulator